MLLKTRTYNEMKLVVCIIIERELDALLLVEQTPGRGYWFPFDEITPEPTRALAAKRIANKVYKFLKYFSHELFIVYVLVQSK